MNTNQWTIQGMGKIVDHVHANGGIDRILSALVSR